MALLISPEDELAKDAAVVQWIHFSVVNKVRSINNSQNGKCVDYRSNRYETVL